MAAQVNEYGMTYSEWLAGALLGARWHWGYHSKRLRRAWKAGECFADYRLMFSKPHPGKVGEWTPTSSHWYHRMLNELPPTLMGPDWFLTCEPNYHAPNGSAVYCLVAQVGSKFYSTTSTEKQAARKVRKLRRDIENA